MEASALTNVPTTAEGRSIVRVRFVLLMTTLGVGAAAMLANWHGP
jgi:hypothetical protein